MHSFGGIVAAALIGALSAGHALAPVQSTRALAGYQHQPQPQERIDINAASLEQLLTVPGMTRTWAARIVRFRPYRAKNDLIDRGIVTSQVYDRIKDYIIVHRAKG